MPDLSEVVLYVEYAYLLLLDLLTAVLLGAAALQFSRKHGWTWAGNKIRQKASGWRTWLSVEEAPQVAKQLQAALRQMLVLVSKFLAAVFFLRLLVVQWYLWRHQAMEFMFLDFPTFLGYPVSMFCIVCQRSIKPSVLDAVYALNQCILVIPLMLAPDRHVQCVVLLTLIPRFLVGISAKHVWIPVAGGCVHALLVFQRLHFGLQLEFLLLQVLELVGMFVLLIVRKQLHEKVRVGLDLKSRQTELDAVSSLLLGFCDSVVEVDEDLRLTEDSRQLSTALLHRERGAEGSEGETAEGAENADGSERPPAPAQSGLAGADFLAFFSSQDRAAVKSSFGQAVGQGCAHGTHALESMGSSIRVELLHTQSCDSQGRPCYLIALREVPDPDAVAPLISETAEASPRISGDASLVFDATDFGILDVSEGFQSLCESHAGKRLSLEGLSIFDLSRGTGPASFSRQLQSAVNAFSEAQPSPRQLRNLDLLGACRVHASVKLQQDHVLDTLVGTVNVTAATGIASTTRRRPRRSGRSNRRESDCGDRQGSILALRRPVIPL